MDTATMIVPEWYRAARQQGATRESLLEEVRAFCLTAVQRRAETSGKPKPHAVEAGFVAMTADIFEHALGEMGQ